MQLSNDQQSALDNFMTFLMDPEPGEYVIAGHSGSGKTTLTKQLIQAIHNRNKLLSYLTQDDSGNTRIYCTATTNKAAAVLGQVVQDDTKTIHSLLGLKVKENYSTGKTSLQRTNSYRKLENCIVIIDEASMMDTDLLKEVRLATSKCKVLYIGDPYQLAPVQDSSCPVFMDLNIPRSTLSTIMRQAGNSPIQNLSDLLRIAVTTGVFPNLDDWVDNQFIYKLDGPSFQVSVNQEFAVPSQPHNHSKILAWTNDKVKAYNGYVRGLHTSELYYQVGEEVTTNKPIVGHDGRTAYKTDEHGIITESFQTVVRDLDATGITLDDYARVYIPQDPTRLNSRLRAFAQNKRWSDYFELKNLFGDVRPIHSSTVHKSQGSTYDSVYIDLTDIGRNHNAEEVARMLYVAITRTSGKVFLYGNLPRKYGGT